MEGKSIRRGSKGARLLLVTDSVALGNRSRRLSGLESREATMVRIALTASNCVPYAQGPSWSCAWGKSGGGGCCGRSGQRQSLGPEVSLQPSRITVSSLSNAMTDVLVKSTQHPASTKGASPMSECGKPAITWPFLLAGGREVTDASSPLAMECTGVPFATQTPIVEAVVL
jgi:hypothetical protein